MRNSTPTQPKVPDPGKPAKATRARSQSGGETVMVWVLLKRIFHRRFHLGVFIALTLVGLAALCANWIAPYPHAQQDIDTALSPVSAQHWMGTDQLGRDLFSRILFGARVSLAVSLGTTLLSLFIGVFWGAISGYRGGKLDDVMMRIVDAIYSFPDLLIIILFREMFQGIIDSDLLAIVLALSLTSWAAVARVVRGEVLRLREQTYVESARALGASHIRILMKHILPNTIGVLVVVMTYRIPVVILAESTLSFLGLGLRPPYASWGTLLNDGWVAMRFYPHLILFPGMAIFLTVLAFNILGDALRDALAPDRPMRMVG